MTDVDDLTRIAAHEQPMRTLAGGAVVHLSAGMSLGDVEDLLRRAGVRPTDQNVIAAGRNGLRSSSTASLSLHQEDYHLERRPTVLCFWCEQPAESGGRTLVAAVDPARLADIAELRNTEVRFFRHSAGMWTPWRPLLERVLTRWWARIAEPDAHRDVEYRLPDGTIRHSMLPPTGALEAIEWAAGDVLLVNNRLAVHGREAIVSGKRVLHRWVA